MLENVELMASFFLLGPNTANETEILKTRNSIFPPSKTSKWGIFSSIIDRYVIFLKIRATKNYCLELGNVELMVSTFLDRIFEK